MSALAADDGTHSFLAFLSAAQKEDGEKQAPEPSIDRLNANEMERLTEAELEEARKPLSGNQ